MYTNKEVAQLAEDYFWSAESWGSEYPPENAAEIIEQANAKIVEFAQARRWTYAWEIEEFSSRLWDRFSRTGSVEEAQT